ncbi:MAG: cytochrome C [Marinilabiliales bacterium]|nr:MAG: cytochrome C [Marinilabiliales bacterium]
MKLPKHYYSWTTFIGAAIASLSFLMIVFLFLLSLLFSEGENYSGLFTFIILPVIMFIGLIMIPIGIFFKKRKEQRRKVEREFKFPIVDFNDSKQRTMLFFITIGLTIFLVLSALGSYQAFHYTESNEFCGTLCHKVMEPEYVAYMGSAHERVNCVECHVGSGAGWYVRSKLSGLYQVYSVIAKAYPTPIETPIHNLRPAQETCERCHWPEKFYDRKYLTHRHYMADEENTEWDISLLLKTSPQYRALGLQDGIHWHINPNVKIEYKPATFKRDVIAWVKYTNLSSGEETIYRDPEYEIDESVLDTLELRTMDCLDCHNRPSHNYRSPTNFIDEAITAGKISSDLPEIKLTAMGILVNDFPTTDSAFAFIDQEIDDFYLSNYPDVYDTNKVAIDAAKSAMKEGYSKNIFPMMKVKWNEYPNYLGHLENDGCYRCHNDRFQNERATTISRDCNLCHLIKAQGTPENMEYAEGEGSLEFKHPIDIGDEWKETHCAECHSALF